MLEKNIYNGYMFFENIISCNKRRPLIISMEIISIGDAKKKKEDKQKTFFLVDPSTKFEHWVVLITRNGFTMTF